MTLVKPLTYGRMGNFLFQVACAATYAWKHGIEFTVPVLTTNPRWNPIYLQHLVNPKWDPSLTEIKIEEKQFTFQELPWDEKWRGTHNIILDGYWQTEKYFKAYRARILAAFGFEWKPQPGMVSVHVRRGDYLKLVYKHPPVPVSWSVT